MTWFAHQNCMSKKNCNVIAIKDLISSRNGVRTWSQEGSFIVSCMWCLQFSALLLSRQRFSFIFYFLCVCRACLLLVRTKLFCLKFFKRLSCLFLLKLVDQSQICFLALLSPLGNFSCWANILGLYIFFLDFRFINYFMDFKRRKILDLQIFLQIVIYKLLL